MKPALVLYHKNCPSGDGFAAAFAAWLSLGDTADYVAADYGDSVPNVAGRVVYILDLSFSEETLTEMSRHARSLTLLDHHDTAQRKLAGFKPLCCGKVHFDLERCGSVLAWEHFHPGEPVPRLFRWLQARDLWTWAEPHAREFLAWLDLQPRTFDAWKDILDLTADTPDGHAFCVTACKTGRELLAQVQHLSQAIAARAVPVTIAGEQGLMVNDSGELRSEVGSLLAQRCGTFGLVWRVSEDGRVLCSLRSMRGYAVIGLAEKFGGGGHATAASFTLPLDKLERLARGVVDALSTTQ